MPAMRITGCCVRPRIAGKPAPTDSTRSILPVGVWLASDADHRVLRLTPHRGQARSCRLNLVNSSPGSLACQRCRSPGAASDPASRASPLLQIQPGRFSLWEPGLPAMRITGCCVRPPIAGKPAPTDSTRSTLPVGAWLASDADHGVKSTHLSLALGGVGSFRRRSVARRPAHGMGNRPCSDGPLRTLQRGTPALPVATAPGRRSTG